MAMKLSMLLKALQRKYNDRTIIAATANAMKGDRENLSMWVWTNTWPNPLTRMNSEKKIGQWADKIASKAGTMRINGIFWNHKITNEIYWYWLVLRLSDAIFTVSGQRQKIGIVSSGQTQSDN